MRPLLNGGTLGGRMDLHPYDGKERRYRDSDANPADALPIVAKLLGLAAISRMGPLRYDLSFFSGGIGVHDVLGITYPCTLAEFEQIAEGLAAKDVAAAAVDPGWSEDFLWLIKADGLTPADAAARFLSDERLDFQGPCTSTSPIRFVVWSDVNDWTALWFDSSQLNYRGYSQG
jgi:hypothetical protein